MFNFFTISGKLDRVLWIINRMVTSLYELKDEAEEDIRVIEQSIEDHEEYVRDSENEINVLRGEQDRIDRVVLKLKDWLA